MLAKAREIEGARRIEEARKAEEEAKRKQVCLLNLFKASCNPTNY